MPEPDAPTPAPGPSRAKDPQARLQTRVLRGPPSPSAAATALRRERDRVADVLHNTICQELTGISLMASAFARQRHEDCPEAEKQFKEVAAMILRAGAGLQEFVRALRPQG